MGCCQSKKIDPIIRRDPITSCDQVLSSEEGRERVRYALSFAPPDTKLRWDKLLLVVNRTIEPTDDEPDPVRVRIDMDELKKTLRCIYQETSAVARSSVVMMHEYLPLLYDKHSVDRGRRVSQKEREARGLIDESYAYGELDPDIFMTIYMKTIAAYGIHKDGIFYDLGCGVGNIVFATSYTGHFKKCCGIEIVDSLLQRGSKRIQRWEKYKSSYDSSIQKTQFDFSLNDFIESDYWTEATFLFIHWTALNNEQIASISNTLYKCNEGVFVLTITHSIPNTDFDLLIKDTCLTSWGEADYYLHIKTTPATKSGYKVVD